MSQSHSHLNTQSTNMLTFPPFLFLQRYYLQDCIVIAACRAYHRRICIIRYGLLLKRNVFFCARELQQDLHNNTEVAFHLPEDNISARKRYHCSALFRATDARKLQQTGMMFVGGLLNLILKLRNYVTRNEKSTFRVIHGFSSRVLQVCLKL